MFFSKSVMHVFRIFAMKNSPDFDSATAAVLHFNDDTVECTLIFLHLLAGQLLLLLKGLLHSRFTSVKVHAETVLLQKLCAGCPIDFSRSFLIWQDDPKGFSLSPHWHARNPINASSKSKMKLFQGVCHKDFLF